MKVGILQCDDVRESLQPNFGNYASMFETLFKQTDEVLELRFYLVIDGQLPQHIDECDVYVCSGSKWGVNDEDFWIRQLEDFIRSLYVARKGLVGICFGHQLMAKALGGEVEKSPLGWGVGIAHAKVLAGQGWMQPKQDNIALVVCHQDQVCKLPRNATVLMSNDFCPYSMFQVDSHFLGLQGHPEFTARYSAALMEQRRDIIPADTIESAMASLSYQADDKLITKWILAFLKQTRLRGSRCEHNNSHTNKRD
ncbi:GMP synthase [Moritella sp. 5]|uniref:glutamine amidotransferase-related protein n=1 Tax=Moritella sp. 5 TaxID=2746231 RepID=UPI001BA90431|nr:GMP synthase [Moritella sp. 5]QUM81234.1 GMP synthase [Moritella sp. 5]